MNASTHFHVPAREILDDEPTTCPYLPHLTLDGLAVTPTGQHHLVMTLCDTARFYVGPDTATVHRRAHILTTALSRRLEPFHAHLVHQWILAAWEATLDELVDSLTTDVHELLG